MQNRNSVCGTRSREIRLSPEETCPSLTAAADGFNPLAIPVSAVIGREGGCLRLGPHSLTIPAGAVDREVTFTISLASTMGVAVDCGPSPFRFNVPVELTLSYAGTQYESSDRQVNLQIFYMANTQACTAMPSHVDVNGKSVSAQLDHFSRYIIG
jgi:hypothetical protein